MKKPHRVSLDDVLDLHSFPPSQIPGLVNDFLEMATQRGFKTVRIIHGKGTGSLREMVHAVLRKHSRVLRFGLSPDQGGWGATVVELEQD